jgi:hypothetical protein
MQRNAHVFIITTLGADETQDGASDPYLEPYQSSPQTPTLFS